jgi:Lipocalin-like domain
MKFQEVRYLACACYGQRSMLSPLHMTGGVPALRFGPTGQGRRIMTPNPLIGTWRLVSWENRSVDGQVSYPLGEDAVGYIMYNQDGYMFVAIMRPNRAKFPTGDLLSGNTEEKAQAAGTYVSYCGRYEYRGDTVLHHVELSLFPNWVGVDQERLVEVRGNRLTLSTRPILLGGSQRTAHLVWERASASKQ